VDVGRGCSNSRRIRHDRLKLPVAPESPLLNRILEQIHAQGAISFASLMAAALYDREHGFYERSSSNHSDYFTSVTVHPWLFGALLTRHLDDVWMALGKPRPFRVIEIAAGDGTLAYQITQRARGYPWYMDLEYIAIERSAVARMSARERVPTAQIFDSIDAIDAGDSAAILSNELFDALPVRIVRRAGNFWVEMCVAWRDGGLVLVPQPADMSIEAYVRQFGSSLPIGGELEMREGVTELYGSIQDRAERWIMTSIDYGGLADEVHGPRFARGSLLSYREHRASENILADPGTVDLTAHVNFSELIEAGNGIGGTTAYWGAQADFLASLGVGEHLPAFQAREGVSIKDYAREREAVFQLVSPTDMGRFRVLVQTQGVPNGALKLLPAPLFDTERHNE